jgi:hypothetical protein
MAGQFLDGQIRRLTSFKDGLNDIRRKEGAPQDPSKVFFLEIKSLRSRNPARAFARQNTFSPPIGSNKRLQHGRNLHRT